MKLNSDVAATQMYLAGKYATNGYIGWIVDGIFSLYIEEGGDTYTITGNTDLRDGKTHFIAVIIDRDNENHLE